MTILVYSYSKITEIFAFGVVYVAFKKVLIASIDSVVSDIEVLSLRSITTIVVGSLYVFYSGLFLVIKSPQYLTSVIDTLSESIDAIF